MKKYNLYFGLILMAVFLGTGYYMETFFRPAHIDELVMRSQIRANHIYILFIALLNIISYRCNLIGKAIYTRYVEWVFRILLICAGISAFIAFLTEHTGDMSERMITLLSVILTVVPVSIIVLHELLYTLLSLRSAKKIRDKVAP